jgi:uncharacterized membrane protein
MGLAIMIVGLAVFIGGHLFTTQRKARADLIARIGEGPYKGIYSLLSFIGLALIVYGFAQYRATGWIEVWSPPAWTRHLAALLVLIAIICIVAAYIPGNIKRVLKHPMLVGVKLWATAHLISNGDLGSIILFGSILGWAVVDRISLKRRTDAGGLVIPVGGWPRDAIAIVVGLLLYLALGLWFHPYVIGVPAFTR